jgi:hypothetical protein
MAYMHDAMEFVLKRSDIGGGLIIYTIAVLEILICVALLGNKFLTLSLLGLLLLIVCILLFHISLNSKGIALALLVFASDVYLLMERKDRIRLVFDRKE